MKRMLVLGLTATLILGAMPALASPNRATIAYPDITLSGGYQANHFADIWDLTAGDITLSFTYDGNGLVDELGGAAHAWAELGVRSVGSIDFNPYWRPGGYTYPPQTVDLLAGKSTDVGDVTVWRDGDTLYVKYIVTGGRCALLETHLAVANSVAAIPQAKGNPIPGQFAYMMVHNPPVTEYTYAVDVTGWAGETKYIAAHAAVTCAGKKDTAWGAGKAFPGKNWATYFTYTPTPVNLPGSGVWLATDYEWSANTFAPDPVGAPSLDLDDKLILQRQGGQDEGYYNLPSTPPAPGNNHRVWWDRDGVDPWQNPATANTGGIYQVVITLHSTSDTTGTAYMNIRGLDQGFETDGNWNTIELTPAGMTFVGDMKQLQVFYGLYGYGATHSVSFTNIVVTQ